VKFRWTLNGVSSRPLKGTGETRCRPSRRLAWLRDHTVSKTTWVSTFGDLLPDLNTLHEGVAIVSNGHQALKG